MLKLLLAPALVVGSSLAGRRWGAHVTGLLVALPIVAGPILLITCLDHGTHFGARTAAASLLGLVSLALFVVVFAWVAQFRGWVASLALAWAACLLADVALSRLTVPPGWGLVLVLAVAWGAAKALPSVPPSAADDPVTGTAWPWWDLPGRAVATAALVLLVTAAASTVGPRLTGVLAPFPIATSVVAAFVLAQQGSAGAVRTLCGVPRGLLGFSLFCFLIAVLVVPLGVAATFVIALVGALAVQFAWRQVLARWDARFPSRAA